MTPRSRNAAGPPRRRLSVGACALAAAGAVLAAGASSANALLFPWTLAPTVPGLMPSASASGDGASMFPDGSGTVVTGNFKAAGLDLGDGVPRTSGSAAAVFFTQKITRGGAVAWTRQSTGSTNSEAYAKCVSTLPDGRSIIAGFFKGDVDLGDGVARSGYAGTMFVQRLGADGVPEWTHTSVPSATALVQAWCVSAMPDGRSVLVGSIIGSGADLGDGVPRSSPPNSFIQMRRADGSVAWTRTTPGQDCLYGEPLKAVSALPDGRSVVAGCFRGRDIDLGDGVPRTSAQDGAGGSAFTQMIGPDGSVLWTSAVPAGSGGDSEAFAVSALPDGRSFITGPWLGSGVDLGDGVRRTSAEGGQSGSSFTQMRRPDGSVAWTTVSGAPGYSQADGMSVSARPDGSVVSAGWFMGDAVTFGDGVPRTGTDSLYTQALRPDGSVAWTSTSAPREPSGVSPSAVSALPDGRLVTAGSFRGTDVDLGGGGRHTSSADGVAVPAYFSHEIMGPPAAPQAPTAVAGAEKATVTVTPLAGGAVTLYTVTASPGGKACIITPPATTCTVTGLESGTPHTFIATATNAAGTSDSSPPTGAATPYASGLSATVRAKPARLAGGQTTRLSIRVVNRKTTAHAVTACIGLPRNVRRVRTKGTATVAGRRVCFAVSLIGARSSATRSITVRAVSTRDLRRVVTGVVRAPGMRAVRARPAVLTISPGPAPPVVG